MRSGGGAQGGDALFAVQRPPAPRRGGPARRPAGPQTARHALACRTCLLTSSPACWGGRRARAHHCGPVSASAQAGRPRSRITRSRRPVSSPAQGVSVRRGASGCQFLAATLTGGGNDVLSRFQIAWTGANEPWSATTKRKWPHLLPACGLQARLCKFWAHFLYIPADLNHTAIKL